ncbi:uncharacterized protein FSUBG_6125 [Fusarium subglutinans]|uniref:Uncharacterized protein n=1 Tax=Gibberella subglutinans TaxID=42677 RepID=A0A8H5Q1H3_GIBSU|nr:uncharacterized protein FSUBG_6125 [Fusarium subglutinans]KAF5606292.1 hypothetical protein FSUBG_6125 [Fusarium subglutinans]
MAEATKETQPRALPTLSSLPSVSCLSSASRCHASTMIDNNREPSSSPRTLPSTTSADSSFQTVSSTGEVVETLPKLEPQAKPIELEVKLQHPAVKLTKARFFADDPYVDRLPQSIVGFYLKKNTISADALVTVPLSIADFKRYEDDIAESVHKRFDYDPGTQEITFRMPTPTHEKFAELVADAIKKKLSKLDQGHSNFIAGIRTVGNARVELEPLNPNAGSDTESKGQEKGPDVQFQHKLTDTPTVILEVAYTQKAEDLPQLALEYIKGSGGDIKVVVGLSIKSNKQSTISIWRTRFEANEDVYIDLVVDSDPFRTADKTPVNETKSLKLYLDDFTFDEFSQASYKDVEISISYGTLCHCLDEAEEWQERREATEVKENRKARRRVRRVITHLPPPSTSEPSEPSEPSQPSASDESEGADGLYRSDDANQSVQTSPDEHDGPTMETRATKKQRRL